MQVVGCLTLCLSFLHGIKMKINILSLSFCSRDALRGASFYVISTDVLLTTSAQAVSFIMAAVSHRKPASATVCRDSSGGRGHDKGDDCSSGYSNAFMCDT